MQTLLFDLGGVVVDYRGPERLAALSKGVMSVADAHAAMSASDNLHAFERGEVSPEGFAEKAVREWRLDLPPAAFIADFETWPERLYPGAKEAIEALKGGARLACLSNINIPHWRQAEVLGLAGLFEHAFLSHEMGSRKPEPAIYEKVLEALNAPAETIVFFDDVPANIAAARAAGLEAHHIVKPETLAPVLKQIARN
ncbi:HAD family hydrolase [Hyphococcus luteus]|uniref:Haloacid dehalogenase n=1 Tax=Hyphococcus luteus TaxID=2058213 RepID=A0A2S7K9G5_9PROT|nr:HAD-IA family hydrolase [Marinicaulis flavus]PQA89164.1 hypothetical protein CW354_04245 [Marinicaulis flavus]